MISTAFMGVAAVSPSYLRRKKDACACKNWKQAYQSGDVKCGAGEEWWEENSTNNESLAYAIPSKYGLYNTSMKEALCALFWEVLDSERCINRNVGEDEGTWCYVNSACESLDGGSKINDQISWKKCSTKDLKFSDYTPEELYNFSKTQDLGFGGLSKMSYPGSRVGEQQIMIENIQDGIPAWANLKLKELGHNNTPYWFDTNEKAKFPFVIVHGSKLYNVEKGSAKDFNHPGTWASLNCTMGC